MKRLPALTLALLLTLLLAGPAAATPQVKGNLTPAPDGSGSNYAYLVCSEEPLDAQNGPDVIIDGVVRNLPHDAGYAVQIGLVPAAVYDDFQAGHIDSLWGEGVYLVIRWDEVAGQFLCAAEDYPLQAETPARYRGQSRIPFQLSLKPRLRRTGGTATLTINEKPTKLGTAELAYGWPENGSERTEDYSVAYLVAQVLTDSATSPVFVKATANQLRDALHLEKIIPRESVNLEKCSTFHRGEQVVVQSNFRIVSTRETRIRYQVKGTVEVFGALTDFLEGKRTGKFGISRNFLVPDNARLGKHTIKVHIELIRYFNDPDGGTAERLLYVDEATKKITVVE